MVKENIHYFRGISIIFIVFGHCYFGSIITFGENKNILAKIFQYMVSGGSAFFVFISGFLFLTIYKSSTKYFDFLLKKIRFVYLPFLFFSSFEFFLIFLNMFINFFTQTYKSQLYWDSLFNFDFISIYLIGKSHLTSGIFWYVPFIMFIYLLSPIFLMYSRLRTNFRIYILLLSLLVSLFLFRDYTYELLSILHNVIYFLPFYLLGILSSQFEEILYKKINNKIIIYFILLYFAVIFIRVIKPFSILIRVDLMLLQKLFFCIIFLVYLKSVNSKNLSTIKILATNSYGIFFIHAIILYLIRTLTSKLHIVYKTESFLIYMAYATVILFISLFAVLIIKRILGSRSKYFIGL